MEKLSNFKECVLNTVKKIPFGKVVSYGQIAVHCDFPRGARQVGWILNRNNDPSVPWWRVINNSGRISIKGSEFTALEQKNLLESEGIPVSNLFELDIEKYRWRNL